MSLPISPRALELLHGTSTLDLDAVVRTHHASRIQVSTAMASVPVHSGSDAAIRPATTGGAFGGAKVDRSMPARNRDMPGPDAYRPKVDQLKRRVSGAHHTTADRFAEGQRVYASRSLPAFPNEARLAQLPSVMDYQPQDQHVVRSTQLYRSQRRLGSPLCASTSPEVGPGRYSPSSALLSTQARPLSPLFHKSPRTMGTLREQPGFSSPGPAAYAPQRGALSSSAFIGKAERFENKPVQKPKLDPALALQLAAPPAGKLALVPSISPTVVGTAARGVPRAQYMPHNASAGLDAPGVGTYDPKPTGTSEAGVRLDKTAGRFSWKQDARLASETPGVGAYSLRPESRVEDLLMESLLLQQAELSAAAQRAAIPLDGCSAAAAETQGASQDSPLQWRIALPEQHDSDSDWDPSASNVLPTSGPPSPAAASRGDTRPATDQLQASLCSCTGESLDGDDWVLAGRSAAPRSPALAGNFSARLDASSLWPASMPATQRKYLGHRYRHAVMDSQRAAQRRGPALQKSCRLSLPTSPIGMPEQLASSVVLGSTPHAQSMPGLSLAASGLRTASSTLRTAARTQAGLQPSLHAALRVSASLLEQVGMAQPSPPLSIGPERRPHSTGALYRSRHASFMVQRRGMDSPGPGSYSPPAGQLATRMLSRSGGHLAGRGARSQPLRTASPGPGGVSAGTAHLSTLNLSRPARTAHATKPGGSASPTAGHGGATPYVPGFGIGIGAHSPGPAQHMPAPVRSNRNAGVAMSSKSHRDADSRALSRRAAEVPGPGEYQLLQSPARGRVIDPRTGENLAAKPAHLHDIGSRVK